MSRQSRESLVTVQMETSDFPVSDWTCNIQQHLLILDSYKSDSSGGIFILFVGVGTPEVV